MISENPRSSQMGGIGSGRGGGRATVEALKHIDLAEIRDQAGFRDLASCGGVTVNVELQDGTRYSVWLSLEKSVMRFGGTSRVVQMPLLQQAMPAALRASPGCLQDLLPTSVCFAE